LKTKYIIIIINSNRVLPRNFGNSSLFTGTCKKSPPARRVSTANREGNGVDVSGNLLLLEQILR
jgi:hypothetical protein